MKAKSLRALYPGTFDPVTFGHVDVIKRAANLFEEVVVAVAHNPQKSPLFSVAERLDLLAVSTAQIPGVKVVSFNGLVVDFARQNGINIVIRGLRMLSDFEYEFQMALTNRKLADDIETVFLMPSESYSYVSSKLLKEAAALGADLSGFLPSPVEAALKKKIELHSKISGAKY